MATRPSADEAQQPRAVLLACGPFRHHRPAACADERAGRVPPQLCRCPRAGAWRRGAADDPQLRRLPVLVRSLCECEFFGPTTANMSLIGIRREKISTKTRTSTTKTITQSPRKGEACRESPAAAEMRPRGHLCFGLEARRDARPDPDKELRA